MRCAVVSSVNYNQYKENLSFKATASQALEALGKASDPRPGSFRLCPDERNLLTGIFLGLKTAAKTLKGKVIYSLEEGKITSVGTDESQKTLDLITGCLENASLPCKTDRCTCVGAVSNRHSLIKTVLEKLGLENPTIIEIEPITKES